MLSRMSLLVLLVLGMVVLTARPALAEYSLSDNLYLSLPNGTIGCVDIFLPDDIGVILPEKIDYTVKMEPSPLFTWGDVSEEMHTTDANNTVKTRVCFSTFNREIGECGAPFTLTISAKDRPDLPERTVRGGVCVSRYADLDTSPAARGQNVSDVLNTRKDIFDMGLDRAVRYAEPGSTADYTLKLQSYAAQTFAVTIAGNVTASPAGTSFSTSPSAALREFNFSVTAPGKDGDYVFTVKAGPRGCSGLYCEKVISGKLLVRKTIPKEAGWTVSAFPENINLKELRPVDIEVTVRNNGPRAMFHVEAISTIPNDLAPADLDVPEGASRSVSFRATPKKASSVYLVEIQVTSAGKTKDKSVYISTNEVLTDAIRETDEVKALVPDEAGELDSSLDSFIDSYRSSQYGQDLNDYADLKDTLDSARKKASQQAAPPQVPQPTLPPATIGEEKPSGPDFTLIIIGVAAAAAVGAVLFFLKKRKPAEEETEWEPLQ